MTSGTLAYSFGLGKAVVSTPYWHARELLGGGRGILVPFGNSATLGSEIAHLLTDDARRQAMRERAYASSRSMTWERTAERYLTAFENARRGHGLRVIARQDQSAPSRARHRQKCRSVIFCPCAMTRGFSNMRSIRFQIGPTAIASMTMPGRCYWHVRSTIRVSIAACASDGPACPFVQHAWNPDKRRFRNFMRFDRRWLEDKGSEDSHGRTLWALGECSQRRYSVAAAVGRRPVCRSTASRGEFSFAARVGIYAARVGRLSAVRRIS